MDTQTIMINQPTLNIGMIGSVSHGKTKLTEKITGIITLKDSKEKKKNITIKLGYANTKIYKCDHCEKPVCYQSFPSNTFTACCKICNAEMKLVKHLSIVDCPGHNMLMATMLNGTCIMNNTILVESINSELPAQQSKEHLIAAHLNNLTNSLVCVNKLDLVSKEIALQKIQLLKSNLKNTISENSQIIPIVANFGINVDAILQFIVEQIHY